MRVKFAGKIIEISKAYIKNKNDRKYLVMVGVDDYIEGVMTCLYDNLKKISSNTISLDYKTYELDSNDLLALYLPYGEETVEKIMQKLLVQGYYDFDSVNIDVKTGLCEPCSIL